jgi:hypothetical protein
VQSRPCGCDSAAAEQKEGAAVPSILYLGRTFEDKGGGLAAAALLRLRETAESPFEASFVGPCPEPLAGRLRAAGIRVHPILTRDGYLRLLAGSDIFLSPTSFESYGMAIHEAAPAWRSSARPGPGWRLSNSSGTAGTRSSSPMHLQSVTGSERSSRHSPRCCAIPTYVVAWRRTTTHSPPTVITRSRDAMRFLEAVYDEATSKNADDGSIAPFLHGDFQITDWSAQLCDWELTRRAPEPVRIRL